MTFEAYEAALIAQAQSLPLTLLAPAALADAERADAATLQAALRDVAAAAEGAATEAAEAAAQAERPAEDGPGLEPLPDRWAAVEASGILDLAIERGGSELLRGFDRSAQPRFDGLWLAGLLDEGPGLDGAESGKPDNRPAAIVATSTTPGGNWVDKNGNGQYDEGEEIVVEVAKTTPHFWTGTETGTGSGTTGGTAGGVGGSVTLPNQQTEDADPTPCVDEVPAGVDLDRLNDLAKGMASQLGALQDKTGWEWGAFIYRATDGQLYQSTPFTAKLHDSLNGAAIRLPNGAHIVGYIHTHPIDNTMDERMLSTADRAFIQNLISNGTPNGTVDPKLIAYVTTKDESTSYHTYVYDKSKRTSTSPGCDL